MRIGLLSTGFVLLALGCSSESLVEGEDAGLIDLDPSDFVFTENEIRSIVLTIQDSDWQELNQAPFLEEYVPGTVDYEGESYSQVGIRYKGAYGSLVRCFTDGERNDKCTKLNFKLKFNEYDPDKRFHTMKRLNLHAMDGDPSFMRETMSYEAYRQHGVYAPRTSYVTLNINGEDLGLYLAVEQIDGRFTRNRFEDGGRGNLYKEVWPNEFTETPYVEALKTNEKENPSVDKMIRFAQDIENGGQEGFRDTLGKWMDTEHWISYFAITRLLGHWDGIFAWYCYSGGCWNHNFYLYESSTEDQFWIVPWDYDHAYHFDDIHKAAGVPSWVDLDVDCDNLYQLSGIKSRAPSCDNLTRWTRIEYWDEYVARTNELIDDDLNTNSVLKRIGELKSYLNQAVLDDPMRDHQVWTQTAIPTLEDEVSTVVQNVQDEIDD